MFTAKEKVEIEERKVLILLSKMVAFGIVLFF